MNVMMSEEEKTKMFNLVRKLEAEGKREEAEKIEMQIPLAPHLAMALKEVCGANHVRHSGFNLSEVEAKYGKDWLDQ